MKSGFWPWETHLPNSRVQIEISTKFNLFHVFERMVTFLSKARFRTGWKSRERSSLEKISLAFCQTQNIWTPSSIAGGMCRLFILGSPEIVLSEYSWDICEESHRKFVHGALFWGCRHPLNKQANETRRTIEEKNSVSRDCFVPRERRDLEGLSYLALTAPPLIPSCTVLNQRPWKYLHRGMLNSTACHHSHCWFVIKLFISMKDTPHKYIGRREVWDVASAIKYFLYLGFPGGAVVKNLPANAGDMGSIPGPGRSHMPQNN